MRRYYTMNIAGVECQLPICPLNDKLSIAGFVIFGRPALTTAAAAQLLEKLPEHDVLVTAESKGIPLAAEMARQEGNSRYVVVRKSTKLYMQDPFIHEVRSISTDHVQTLCLDREEAEYIKGKRVAIVDDVISTGESLKALEALVNAAGGIIVAKAAILAEGDAADRKDIIFLKKLPLFTPEGEPLD